jgi:hypothetical protein
MAANVELMRTFMQCMPHGTWDTHHMEKEWELFLIDTHYAFNEQDQVVMRCIVQHELQSGSWFVFNT